MSLLLCFVILTCFSSCVSLQPVTVKRLDDFSVKTLSTRPSISFKAIIHNPNPFGLTMRTFSCEVMLGNKKISSVSAGRRVRIASRSDAAIPLEVAPDLMNVTGLILNGQSLSDFSAEGSITVSKFLFRKKFPFSVRINP